MLGCYATLKQCSVEALGFLRRYASATGHLQMPSAVHAMWLKTTLISNFFGWKTFTL